MDFSRFAEAWSAGFFDPFWLLRCTEQSRSPRTFVAECVTQDLHFNVSQRFDESPR
jgi:hypothetical protein